MCAMLTHTVITSDVTKLVKNLDWSNANFDFQICQMRIEAFILSAGK